ncbi:MAG: metallophosphoesterase [Spirochaetales bacterium]
MVYITGDTHRLLHFEKLQKFAKSHPNLTKNDYVIIVGDCGIVWSKETLEESIASYERLPFSVLFIDGNHENFDLLNAYQVENWHGGKTHKISEHIRHLMRGQIFEIEGKTFFTLGGANSTDRETRTEGLDWWKEEAPNAVEIFEANKNLEKVGYKVDYVLTHTIDSWTMKNTSMAKYPFEIFMHERYLDYFDYKINYKHWYFGHFHIDEKITDKKTSLFNKVYKLGTTPKKVYVEENIK